MQDVILSESVVRLYFSNEKAIVQMPVDALLKVIKEALDKIPEAAVYIAVKQS